MEQLREKIKKARKFEELSRLINNTKYFLENDDNEYSNYYKTWFLELNDDEVEFATISNKLNDEYSDDYNEDEEYHIVLEIDEDVKSIKDKLTKLSDEFHDEKIDRYTYNDELKNIFDSMKVKNANLERV